MKLPFLNKEKKEKSEYFLILLLKEDSANAVIFREVEGQLHIIGKHHEAFPTPIETVDQEAFLDILDKVISTAESNLPPKIETQKTLFGVKEDWIEENKIKKNYLSKLKKACDVLGLIPIGFIVINEAISKLLQSEEGAPVSAIYVEIQKKDLVVSLLRAGKVIETHHGALEESISQTTDKILHYFTNYQVLPARIIVENGFENELSQELIQHKWSKSLPFLHIPQITILPESFDEKALVFGAATQMGFSVPHDIGAIKHITSVDDENQSTQPLEEEKASSHSLAQEKKDTHKETHEEELSDANEFGFVTEKDVATEAVAEAQTAIPEELLTKKSHDFVIHGTQDAKHHQPEISSPEISDKNSFQKKEKPGSHIVEVLSSTMQGFTARLRKISISKPSFLFAIPGGRGNKLIFIPPLILIICIGLVILYLTTLKASIQLHVIPKDIEKETAVVFTPDSTQGDKNSIQIETASVTENGTVSAPVTGKKEIGDKAKGSVTILSSSTKSQSIPSGTIITSSNGLDFVLDNSVNLASSSGVSDIKSIQASVTAKNIGKDYNIPSGTKFSVGDFDRSSVEAKNDSAFSGGSKKDVTVVSKKDVDGLTSDLTDKLEEKAKNDLAGKISADKILLPLPYSTTIENQSLSKKIGDEATSVSLTGTVSYDAFIYSKDTAKSFAQSVLHDDMNNMILTSSGIEQDVKDVKENKDKTINGTLILKAHLLPHIDISSLTKEIAGKSFDEAKTILEKIDQVKSVDITLQPNLSFLPKKLPLSAQNIQILISTNE